MYHVCMYPLADGGGRKVNPRSGEVSTAHQPSHAEYKRRKKKEETFPDSILHQFEDYSKLPLRYLEVCIKSVIMAS